MILYSESISSAFGDPPDSGVRKSANAPLAKTSEPTVASSRAATRRRRKEDSGRKAARILLMERRSASPGGERRGSAALERRGTLLQEGCHTLREVVRQRLFLLDRGLELELLLEPVVRPRVELPLRPCVRQRRAHCEPLGERVGGSGQPVVGVDGVDETPLERSGGVDALAEHRHLARARESCSCRDKGGGAAVRHEADVHEGQQEV